MSVVKKLAIVVFVSGILFVAAVAVKLKINAASLEVFSEFEQTTDAEVVNIISQDLQALQANNTGALLIVKNDQLIYEWYSQAYDKTTMFGTASLAKSVVGGFALLKAASQGYLSVDDYVYEAIPSWKTDKLRQKIQIKHLASHSSGIDDTCAAQTPENQCTDWQKKYWPHRHDKEGFIIANTLASVIFEPGTQFTYSNPAYSNVLSYAITSKLQNTPYPNIRDLLHKTVAKPIGIPKRAWAINGEQFITLEGYQLVSIGGDSEITSRATARLGQLLLHSGKWQGKSIISSDLIKQYTVQADTTAYTAGKIPKYPKPGIGGWWLNENGTWQDVPKDAVLGAGAGHQILLIIPSLDLVVVRYGKKLGKDGWDGDFWEALETKMLNPLIEVINKIQTAKISH